MKATISVVLKVADSTYNVEMDLPSSTLSSEEPFRFSLKSGTDSVIAVAFGDSSHCYVGVNPPSTLLKKSNIVESLGLEIIEGNYDKNKGTFGGASAAAATAQSGTTTTGDTGTNPEASA